MAVVVGVGAMFVDVSWAADEFVGCVVRVRDVVGEFVLVVFVVACSTVP